MSAVETDDAWKLKFWIILAWLTRLQICCLPLKTAEAEIGGWLVRCSIFLNAFAQTKSDLFIFIFSRFRRIIKVFAFEWGFEGFKPHQHVKQSRQMFVSTDGVIVLLIYCWLDCDLFLRRPPPPWELIPANANGFLETRLQDALEQSGLHASVGFNVLETIFNLPKVVAAPTFSILRQILPKLEFNSNFKCSQHFCQYFDNFYLSQ